LKLVNPRLVLMMVALPAVLELKKLVTAEKPLALLVMTALPAVLLLMNDSVDMGPASASNGEGCRAAEGK
jgi:hypothetical protein